MIVYRIGVKNGGGALLTITFGTMLNQMAGLFVLLVIGFYEGAVFATVIILLAELVFSRLPENTISILLPEVTLK